MLLFLNLSNQDKRYIPGVVLCLLALLIGAWVMPDYGLSIDEPLHIHSGKLNCVEFWGDSQPIESYANLRFYGPLSDIIGYVSSQLFQQWYGLNLIDAWHLHHLFFFAGAVVLFYCVALFWWSPACAALCTLLLLLTPRIAGHVPINPKSIPLFFWSLLLLFCLQKWFARRQRLWIVLAGCAAGFGFASRAHGALIIVALMNWFIATELLGTSSHPKTSRRLHISDLVIMTVTGLATTYLSWPWLRNHPVQGWIELITFYSSHPKPGFVLYLGKIWEIGSTPWHYAPVYFLVTTPLTIIVFGIIGAAALYRNSSIRNHHPFLALVLWLGFCSVPFSLPGSVVYDGPRHLLLAYPPLLLMAGFGLFTTVRFINRRVPQKTNCIGGIVAGAIILQLIWINVQYHPFQMVYYNCLTGGVQGAEGSMELWSWGHSIRKVVQKINAMAEPGDRVYVCYPRGLAEYTLRRDLFITSSEPDYIVTTTFRSPEKMPPNYKEVDTVKVNGVILNRIFRKIPDE